ncbi:TonB-dependent Receptor Plug Domain [Ekhidna lutea]|uniref:TonB-dependent Receptor Plug Domain n=1 Tax=Ekhidna lutea TaxID=447679 RepID=A0A239GYU2_EKHLU|nr:TonB-dependent receptor [Ekhidna lutea]SNS74035.1 TonB-dependent Receptor Plug Domain [Ekhidna lutea]
MIHGKLYLTLKRPDTLRIATALIFSISCIIAAAQVTRVRGVIVDESNEIVPSVNIILKSDRSIGTISNINGVFEINLSPGKHTLVFSHVQYHSREIDILLEEGETQVLQVLMSSGSTQLDDVQVEGVRERDAIDPAAKIDAKAAQNLPSAFGDFNKVLLTLPGVAGNNELSSAYNVRGGNFDENLVYVNDIPVYRPFLANAGRQEGLSFVNPDLVGDISFYAGGWEAKYGDKLSSSLNIDYKEPESLEGQLNGGLLGGSAYIGNRISEDVQYLFGARHRDSRYLLNTLETDGQYLPSYTDAQAFFTFDLTGDHSEQINRTKLNWLLAYGRNRYLTLPASQTTEFGSVSSNLRVQTAFDGREELDYDTYQSGFNLSHRWSDRFLSRLIASGVYTSERENYNVEGAYRICDIDNNPGSNSFNECVVVRGIGTNFNYGRNRLKAQIYNMEWRNEYLLSDWTLLEAGIGYNKNIIDDELNEYAFLDSAGFVTINESTFNELALNTTTLTAYTQATIFSKDSMHAVNAGVRVNRLSYNEELLISPRIIYRFKTNWEKETSFRVSIGKYSQTPFYRELRDQSGEIRENVKAQQSLHFIGAMERIITWWNRPFLFTAEGYYKSLTNVIPYDIDNVRLRYFANNDADAFAYGFDFRINGEFIRGTQSWFSLGILKTKEDIAEDDKGFIRRPSDQNINLAFYFEDHLPSDPTLRVYVNSVFGSGYPLGPPNEINARNIFSGDEYYRIDMGLSKSFELKNHKYLKTFWLRAEVLNVLGADNTLSYSWIQDVTGSQLAIPNSLSARFLNLRISADF